MSDAGLYGKSYWELVVHAFRKNRAALMSLWFSVGLLLVAILAPLLANDRPFVFTGTMPGEYRKAYRQIAGPAFQAIFLQAPNRLKAESRQFQDKSASLNDYLRRLTEGEASVQYDFITRLRKRAESRPDTRAPWISREVPLADVEGELKAEQAELPGRIAGLEKDLSSGQITPEQKERKKGFLDDARKAMESIPGELAMLEAARQRILRDLPEAHGKTLAGNARGVRLKLIEMGLQLDDAKRVRAAEFAKDFDRLVGGDYLTTAEDRRSGLIEFQSKVKAEFDPETNPLRPRRYWPLLDSLTFLDVFFVTTVLLAAFVFGPLTWWRLKRVLPIERRWRISWLIAATPALLLSLSWLQFHESKFETASFKKGSEDGSIVMTSALWPPLRYRYDEVPNLDIKSDADRPPLAPSKQHWLGTDYMGRDLLTRMIWGSRVSLSIGFVAEAIALFIGIVLGALAGYYRGKTDMLLSRIIEIMICFPTFFLVLAVVAFLPPSIFFVMLVLGIFGWMGIARLLRGEFLRLINLDFVQAARALGASDSRIMFRHLLPNSLAPVLVAASFGIATAMLTESSLSFLGFGVMEPETSWGQILYTGRAHLDKWWTFLIPGAAIFLAVTCYNLVGDGIRDATDPRLKG